VYFVGNGCGAEGAGSNTASRTTGGRPPCKNSIDRSATSCSPYFSFNRPVGVKRPMIVASTDSLRQSASSSGHCASETDSTIRSCASEIHISVYDRPSYFSGIRSSHTSAPISSPISPTALLKPPAPQSVIEL
jgi:hypothetical protein